MIRNKDKERIRLRIGFCATIVTIDYSCPIWFLVMLLSNDIAYHYVRSLCCPHTFAYMLNDHFQ